MEFKIKKLCENADIPQRATNGAAGYDLRACLSEDLIFAPMERKLIPTGLALELPNAGYAAFIFARSGLALKQGLAMANGVGVVDSDYRGELCVPAVNLSDKEICIKHGERVAQMLIMPVETPELVVEEGSLAKSERGSGGFGSTGVV